MELVCSKCGETKEAELFKKDKNRKHGRSSWCKACHSRQTTLTVNRDKANRNNRKYTKTTKGKIAKKNYKVSRRAKLKVNLTKEERKEIKELYKLALELREHGFDVEVDHIIPLSKGGHHHSSNLQILFATHNRSKSNKII